MAFVEDVASIAVYDRLRMKAMRQLDRDQVITDACLDHIEEDMRLGQSLIAHPDKFLAGRIEKIVDLFREVEPDQYYYAPEQLHMTIQSIFTATAKYGVMAQQIHGVKDLIETSLSRINEFHVLLEGVSAVPNGIIVKGYTQDRTLKIVRNELREKLRALVTDPESIERYPLKTIHLTAVRYKKQLQNKSAVVDLLEKYKDFRFGFFTVQRLLWVKMDWYLTPGKTEILGEFMLNPSIRT